MLYYTCVKAIRNICYKHIGQLSVGIYMYGLNLGGTGTGFDVCTGSQCGIALRRLLKNKSLLVFGSFEEV